MTPNACDFRSALGGGAGAGDFTALAESVATAILGSEAFNSGAGAAGADSVGNFPFLDFF